MASSNDYRILYNAMCFACENNALFENYLRGLCGTRAQHIQCWERGKISDGGEIVGHILIGKLYDSAHGFSDSIENVDVIESKIMVLALRFAMMWEDDEARLEKGEGFLAFLLRRNGAGYQHWLDNKNDIVDRLFSGVIITARDLVRMCAR